MPFQFQTLVSFVSSSEIHGIRPKRNDLPSHGAKVSKSFKIMKLFSDFFTSGSLIRIQFK